MATKTAARTKTVDRWVICDDYAAGPFAAKSAVMVARRHDKAPGCMHTGHKVIQSDRRPTTVAALRTMYSNWFEPYTGDVGDGEALTARRADGADLAAAILEVGARESQVSLYSVNGTMSFNGGGWSKDDADRADAAAEPGSDAWKAALGPYRYAILTADGRGAIRDRWCECGVTGERWVQYEVWTAEGRERHGFVCPDCRKLTQTG